MQELTKFPEQKELESPQILKALISAHSRLGELKGIIPLIPNDRILLSNLSLQEAKDSSAIENIITTQDSLYRHCAGSDEQNPANKEIRSYAKALEWGYKEVQKRGGISLNTIIGIQKTIDPKRSGFRKLPGTVLKNLATNRVVYTPPLPDQVPSLMADLEAFINKQNAIDPLVKTALIHHRFESIHPFYDGNGRTGRILNILYLISKGLLESPVLYLSRYIHKNRPDYYRLLQEVRQKRAWTEWIVYMLKAVEDTSQDTTKLIKNMFQLFKEYKERIREKHKFYSQDLINNIFTYPYTKIKFLERDMKISWATARRYLDELAQSGIMEKKRFGKESYYINYKLFDLLKDS